MKGFHVSIIGAGLGGLCLAQGLQRAGIDFDVFERDAAPDSRPQGYRIRIDADGQRALSACLPPGLDLLFRQSCAVATSAGRFLDHSMAPTQGRPAQNWSPSAQDGDMDEDDGDLSANRQTLREILLCGIERRVHFGKAYGRHMATANGGLRVDFEDGSSVSTSVLVGADGVNSQVRRRLAPDAEPVDTGAVCLYGKTIATPEVRQEVGDTLCDGTSVIFADGFAAILDAMRFRAALPSLAMRLAPGCRLSAVDDYLYWALIGPGPRLGLNASMTPAPDRLAAHVTELVQDWHPRLQAVFRHGDARSIAMLPVRSARLQASWPAGLVTLLGDAVHVMSPAGGVGANTALQDAADLAECLARVADGRAAPMDALTSYESQMRARAAQAIRASEEGALRLSGGASIPTPAAAGVA